MVHFTQHPDFIELKGYASYYEITIDVALHGIDCVSHYKLYLCHDKECQDLPVTQRGNVTFANLQDGQHFKYQLMGYNDEEIETYVTEQFDIQTPLNVTTEFTLDKASNTSITLHFHSSVFDHFDEKDLDKYTVVAACGSAYNQVTNYKKVTLENLDPFTEYECNGQFQYDGKYYDIKSIKVKTEHGTPSAPLYLSVDKIGIEEAFLEWTKPEVSNGIIELYKIKIRKICESHPDDQICHEICTPDESTVITDGTEETITKLTAWTHYEISVAAKTKHPEYGPFSQPIRLKTLPGKPKVPEILGEPSQTKRGGIMIEFNYPCPLTGPTAFFARYEASVDKSLFLGNATQVTHRPLAIEIVGLPGGHNYDVWIEACVEDECQAGKSKIVTIVCEHKCSDGTCLHWNAKCNYVRECPDGSDEQDCPCDPPLYFRCDNSYCIPSWRQCDGINDCNDKSDETSCPSCVADDQFRCKESGECLSKSQKCDHKVDCRDGSDESGCNYWKARCWPEKFRCLDHSCVNMKHRCDKIWDCKDGEDEYSCNNGCPNGGQFRCRNRQCIAMSRYCDGVADCDDGSDEVPACRCHIKGLYACKRGGQCISRSSVCDGHLDCHDGSDERNCRHIKNTTLSRSPAGLADKGAEGTKISYRKDNILYEDLKPPQLEAANLVQIPRLDLKVYPPTQSVYKHSDVVLQCRDEGEIRSQVQWVRADGKPLPKHSFQKRGRLEIRRIGSHGGGLFLCYAVGHDKDKGGRVLANVEVLH